MTLNETRTGPLVDLQRALDAEFGRDAQGAGVAALLADYAAGHEDWRRHALFAPAAYTRNLVARTAWYELLVLCWDAGQESPIHNHAGQNCWMAVLAGEIEEIQFHVAPRGGPLERGKARTFGRGRCAFIRDEIALHLVRPGDGRRGVSLHLYSRPIDACDVYEPDSGRIVRRSLGYHSVDGALVAG
jgi:cysteine dioxygenase